MKTYSRLIIGLISSAFVLSLVFNTNVNAHTKGKGHKHTKECTHAIQKSDTDDGLKAQTTCPVMGNPINKNLHVDVDGYRFYVCCNACIDKIKADPKQAIADLKKAGQKPEKLLVVCDGCGEIKGSANCCNPKAEKCSKCGLNKGSVGCCSDLKPADGEKKVLLCGECGEVKGSEACCAVDAKKCSACGLHKGSPGCCKVSAPMNKDT